MSDKYDSVNKHTQEISKLIQLHIQGVWQNTMDKFIKLLAHNVTVSIIKLSPTFSLLNALKDSNGTHTTTAAA